MKTTIHYYYLDVSEARGKKTYEEVRRTIRERPRAIQADMVGYWKVPETQKYEEKIQKLVGREQGQRGVFSSEIEIDPTYLFDNQWNTREGLRVFNDWRCITENKDLKIGYWIDVTEEMGSILETTVRCGFCGKQYSDIEEHRELYGYKKKPKSGLCPECRDSRYLKRDEWRLRILRPVSMGLMTPSDETIEELTGRSIRELEEIARVEWGSRSQTMYERALSDIEEGRRRFLDEEVPKKLAEFDAKRRAIEALGPELASEVFQGMGVYLQVVRPDGEGDYDIRIRDPIYTGLDPTVRGKVIKALQEAGFEDIRFERGG